jgi:hypothetical protein
MAKKKKPKPTPKPKPYSEQSMYISNKIWTPVYEGEGEGGEAAPTAVAPAAAPAAASPATSIGGVEFSAEQQKAMNGILAQEKRQHQKVTQKALDEAQAASKKAQLTTQERKDLEQRLGQLQDELLTKEELSKKHAERQRMTYEEKVNNLTGERDSWQERYTESTIKRSITDAAATNNAFSPRQIVSILGAQTRLVEVLDQQGKPTGKLEPKVKFDDVDKDDNPVVLDLSPKEAVKRMKEMEEYLNLFKGEGTGGAGMRSQPGGRKPDVRDLARDPAAYRAARKKGEFNF